MTYLISEISLLNNEIYTKFNNFVKVHINKFGELRLKQDEKNEELLSNVERLILCGPCILSAKYVDK